MKLIVGLGNPGREYRETRHNIGFMVVDEIARRHSVDLSVDSAMSAQAVKVFATTPFLLAKPLTFMNASGEAVGALAKYYRVPAADVLVIYDDVDLPFGKLRARPKGSAGTHKGMRSIVTHIGMEFPRLRLGVGRGDARRDLADYVLAKFDRHEQSELSLFVPRAADAAEMFVAADIFKVMNVYNAGPADPAESN